MLDLETLILIFKACLKSSTNESHLKKDTWEKVSRSEYFEMKWVCKFNYEGEILKDLSTIQETTEVDEELVKSVVYGDDHLQEQRINEMNNEISTLKTKEKELK